MEFAHPIYLGLTAAAVALVIGLLIHGVRRRAQRLGGFAAPGLVAVLTQSLSGPKHWLKAGLLVVGLASVGVALAQPRLGSDWEKVERKGIDLMFAVDVSRSMLAEDVTPDRLERAKLAVEDLVDAFEGDRVGLVAFAADAFLQCPLTLDRDVFHRALGALDPSLMSRGGSDLAAAIETARSAASSEEGHDKLLVLITDGEDLGGEALAAARRAAQDDIKIYTVGVGDPEGALIPVVDAAGAQTYLRDANGELVRTRLDEDTLKQMAELSGGAYAALGSDGQGLRRMYEEHLAALPQRAVSSRMRRIPIERFMWPLAAALLFLLVEPLIGRRRRSAVGWSLALLLAVSGVSNPAQAADNTTAVDAIQLYDDGQFEQAEAEWSNRLTGASVPEQGTLYYHRGNARYRQGEAVGEEEVETRRARWQSALTDYRAALALDPKDEDAAFNFVFVAKKLQALNEQNPPPEDKSSCDNPQQQDDGSGDQQESDKQDGSGDDQDQNEGDGNDQDQNDGDGSGESSKDSDGEDGQNSGEQQGEGSRQGEGAEGQGDDGKEAGQALGDKTQTSAKPPAGGAEQGTKQGTKEADQPAGRPSGQPSGQSPGAESAPAGEKKSAAALAPGEKKPGEPDDTQGVLRLTPKQAARLLKSVDAHAQGGVLLVPAGQSATPDKDDEEKNW